MPRRSRTSGRSVPRTSSRARAGGTPRSASNNARTSSAPVPLRSAAKPSPSGQKSQSPASAGTKQQQGSAMGGFMSNVASTGLGVMAGRAMDRAFFGGPSAGSAPENMTAEQEESSTGSAWDEQVPENICAREALEFKKCMEKNSSDLASCQWNLDILAACQRQQGSHAFADGARF